MARLPQPKAALQSAPQPLATGRMVTLLGAWLLGSRATPPRSNHVREHGNNHNRSPSSADNGKCCQQMRQRCLFETAIEPQNKSHTTTSSRLAHSHSPPSPTMRVAFVFTALVAAVCGQRVALEPNQHVRTPEGWTAVGPAPLTDKVTLDLAVKLTNLDALDKLFWEVSSPSSSKYGQHLSLAEVDALVHPSREAVNAVEAWLQQYSVDTCKRTSGHGFVTCTVDVATASLMLDTTFVRFTHPQHPGFVVRAAPPRLYTVAASVAPYLDFVGGVHRFPAVAAAPSPVRPRRASAVGVTPGVLRKRYNITEVGQVESNAQSVAQFLGQYFHQPDLAEFWLEFGNGFKHLEKVSKYLGPDTGITGTEAALDVEYIMSTGANITTWFWSTGGHHEGQERFLYWITGVANTTDAPKVHSVSYGDDEDSLDLAYMERINVEFQKMGVRGLSIMFASGDSGAGCNEGGTKFVPSFPATSPYVTAVGGTLFAHNDKEEDGNYISSGGFSNVFGRPEYQVEAVKHYMSVAKDLPKPSFYNATGRGFPDVAAASSGFWVVANLIPTPGVAGTSCASPTFSGVIALLNDLRARVSKPTLGFLNPLLYANVSSSLYDVVEGCNAGCEQSGFCSAVGWDPVTGLGTPDFARLSKTVV
eukprot:m.336287 g.336287  ORF g.336287 m.336287 type:complete len:645 (-) comp19795_c1_seq2:3835-5769(-)